MSIFPQHQDLLKVKLKQFLALTSLNPSNNWSKSVIKDSLSIHTHKDSKGVMMIRSEGSIPCPIEQVFSIFWSDVEALKKVDTSVAGYEILERSKDDTQIIVHNILKAQPLVTPRDMVMIMAHVKEKSRYIVYGSSIKYPEEKGYIRAECNVWGWIFNEDEANKGRTWAINVNYTDLGGMIPSFVVKPVLIKEHGYLIKRVSSNTPTPINKKIPLKSSINAKL